MKLELTAFDLYWLVKELKVLEGGRVNKIYSPVKNEYLFLIWIPRVGRRYLRFVLPSVLFFDDEKGEQELRPSSFVMFLRKHLMNHALRKIEQAAFERILRIEFEKEAKKLLVFELFGKGNIVLLDEHDKIISALERQDFKDRAVTKGNVYCPPVREYNAPNMSLEDFRSALSNTKQDSLVKFLAVDLGLGGLYSEEVCARANLDKSKLPSDIKPAYDALRSIFDCEPSPHVYEKDDAPLAIAPIKLENIEAKAKPEETFNKAIRNSLGRAVKHKRSARGKAALEKKIQKTAHALEMQTKALQNLQESADENQHKGEYIYENYNKISTILDQLKTARKKHSWNEIKEKLKDHKVIKEVNATNGTVTVESEE